LLHHREAIGINQLYLPDYKMTPEKLIGQHLGPYKIESILESGGMAVVYRAQLNDTAVALKVLFPPPSAGEEIWLRFEREARTAG